MYCENTPHKVQLIRKNVACLLSLNIIHICYILPIALKKLTNWIYVCLHLFLYVYISCRYFHDFFTYDKNVQKASAANERKIYRNICIDSS